VTGQEKPRVYYPQVKWDELQVLSAVPVKKESGEFVPVCRSLTEEPDGLQFNVLFRGTTKKEQLGERDISIKPFDTVEFQTIHPDKITSKLFELDISCLESLPDDDLYACSGQFTGGDDLPIEQIDYYDYNQPGVTTDENVAVAVLMDMSGSMNGLVMPAYPFQEGPFETVGEKVYDLAANATDPKDARYGALESFVKTLNDDDALILFAFNESGIDVVCEINGNPDATKTTKLEDCFGTDRDLILSPPAGGSKSAIENLQGEERGRTPLWSAVEDAYQYMRGQHTEAQVAGVNKYMLRHLLVIGDGPDTCASSPEQDQCEGGCLTYSTSYESVRDMIELEAMADRIPIHFVQMAAKGYPERDPRQQEIACLTGGHYTFVNTLDIPMGVLQDVLTQTINRIRYTFRGYWRFQIPLGSVKKANEPPRGWLHSLTGGGRVMPGIEGILVKYEDIFLFKVNDESVSGSNSADKRVTFRKECDPSAPSVCPASEAVSECSSSEWWCDAQTLTCLSSRNWTPNGEQSSCKPQSVYLSVETRTKVGETIVMGSELYQIKDVETRCCRGTCMPPNPPVVPAEVAKPAGSAAACFWYGDAMGWVLADPAEIGQSSSGSQDNLSWVYFATINVEEDCLVEDFEPYLSSYSSTDFDAEDWSHCSQDVNCFLPPVP